jgi:hypothetical protein
VRYGARTLVVPVVDRGPYGALQLGMTQSDRIGAVRVGEA